MSSNLENPSGEPASTSRELALGPSPLPSPPPVPSSNWGVFLWVCAALCVGVMSTALISPLYPIYQTQYGFSNTDISYIHIVYMAGAMTSLLFLGNLNSYFGFWLILRTGLILMIVGLSLLMISHSISWLILGRILVGIASGMISTSTMLGMIKTIPPHMSDRAPQYASIINVFGFGLGPLMGGIVAEFFPWPLVLPFLVMMLAAVGVSLQLIRKGKQVKDQGVGEFTLIPDMRTPPPPGRSIFWIISLGAFLAFGVFSFFGSLATSFLHEFLADAGPLINGISVSAVLLISGVVQFTCKSFEPRKSFLAGLGMLGTGCLVLIGAIAFSAPQLFVVAVILSGIGHGLTLVTSFAMLHRISTPEIKSAALSSFLFIGYLGTIIPVIISGYVSDWFGLNTGVVTFSIMMIALAITLALKIRQRAKTTPAN